MKRRELFTSLLLEAPPAGWPRPPGAGKESDFLSRCTGCDDCFEACPHDAIGRLGDGTPALNPNVAACHLCDDAPCAVACKDGALVVIPADVMFFGIAAVEPDKCMVFRGPECGACRVCPIKALTLSLGKPQIDPEICNGCGLCRDACPVWGKAITITW